MVVKYKGVWNMHMMPAKLSELYFFFKKLEGKKETKQYGYMQILRIREATYNPLIVKREGESDSPDDERILKEVEESRATLFDDLMINGQIALDEGVIDPKTFMRLEALVYDAKD